MYIREALSFLDGGNSSFIELLLLIGKLKQVNASNESCTIGALQIWYQSQVEIFLRKVELEIIG